MKTLSQLIREAVDALQERPAVSLGGPGMFDQNWAEGYHDGTWKIDWGRVEHLGNQNIANNHTIASAQMSARLVLAARGNLPER